MLIRLLKMWHRKETESVVDVTPGVADYLIRAGIGESYDENPSRTSNGTDSGTVEPVRGKKASRDRNQRYGA